MSDIRAVVAHLLRPLQRRVDGMIARCVVRAVDPDRQRQTVQITLLDGEVAEGVEHMEPYGFTSHPHPDGGGIAFHVGGSRAHPLAAFLGGKKYRKKGLKKGEAALYTDEGDYILLQRGRIVEVVAGSKVRLQSPLVEATEDLRVMGNLTVDGNATIGGDASVTGNIDAGGTIHATGQIDSDTDVVAAGVSLKNHTHGGVTSGGANTAPPN